MAFLNPALLFALSAVAVPIAIHLFNLRRFKKVYFSDLRFLREVQIQTRNRNRLRHLLILAARCLAIIFLVLAFAQPVIPHGEAVTNNITSHSAVFIDNSFSADASGPEGILLNAARSRGLSVSEAFARSRGLAVITNQFGPGEGRLLSVPDAREAIAQLGPSSESRNLGDVLRRLVSMQSGIEGHELYVVSDLQRHQFTNLGQVDSAVRVFLIPLTPEKGANLDIDSCWFPSPVRMLNQPDEIMARVRNHGTQAVSGASLSLSINNSQRSVLSVDIEAESYEDVKLGFTLQQPGPQFFDVSVIDHPITFDDIYRLSFNVAAKVSILDVQGPAASTAFADLYLTDPLFTYQTLKMGAVDLAAVSQADLIILNGFTMATSGLLSECAELAKTGGSILWAPSRNISITEATLAANTLGIEGIAAIDTGSYAVKDLALSSLVYRNVFNGWKGRTDLPKMSRLMRPISNSALNREDLMRTGQGDPVLSAYQSGQGRVYALFAPLDDKGSNLTRHALFVPTFFNMAAYARSVPESALRTDREEGPVVKIPPGMANESIRLLPLDGGAPVVPEVQGSALGKRIFLHGQSKIAGHYLVMAGQDTLSTLSLNYPRTEGVPDYLTAQQAIESLQLAGLKDVRLIDATPDRLALAVEERHSGVALWRWMLFFAFLMIVAETLLIRFAR